MTQLPNCPRCKSEFVYQDGETYICPECGHEWISDGIDEEVDDEGLVVIDSAGNELADGDSITVIKDLKVKG